MNCERLAICSLLTFKTSVINMQWIQVRDVMFLQVAAAAECSYLFTMLFYRLYSTDAIFFHVSIATSTCYRYNCSAQCLCEKHTSQRRSPNASHKTRLLLYTASLYTCTCIYSVSQKNIPDIFSCNSRKHCRIFIMFGTHVTEKLSNQ